MRYLVSGPGLVTYLDYFDTEKIRHVRGNWTLCSIKYFVNYFRFDFSFLHSSQVRIIIIKTLQSTMCLDNMAKQSEESLEQEKMKC